MLYLREETDLIIIHCSNTPPTMDIGKKELNKWYRQRGYSDSGFHFVIRRDGTIETGRNPQSVGAHAVGHNFTSIGICLIGGVNKSDVPENNFTPEQWDSLVKLLKGLKTKYPEAKIIGHNEVAQKSCPSFDVQKWKTTVGL